MKLHHVDRLIGRSREAEVEGERSSPAGPDGARVTGLEAHSKLLPEERSGTIEMTADDAIICSRHRVQLGRGHPLVAALLADRANARRALVVAIVICAADPVCLAEVLWRWNSIA